MSKCPQCGKEFGSERSMKIHHAKAHGEKLVEEPDGPECPTCGRRFKNESAMKVHHAKAHSESIAGVEVECAWCGESIRRSRYFIERSEKLFCGAGCRHEYQREHWQGEGHPSFDRAEVECAWCGATHLRKQSMVGFERHYCDYECQAAWQSASEEWRVRNSGENAPQWKGGYTYDRGTDWPALRASTLEEYDYTCQGCGVTDDDHREEHGVGLDIHHIRPVTEFDEPADADTVDNLVPLCWGCHREWEGIPLRPELSD